MTNNILGKSLINTPYKTIFWTFELQKNHIKPYKCTFRSHILPYKWQKLTIFYHISDPWGGVATLEKSDFFLYIQCAPKKQISEKIGFLIQTFLFLQFLTDFDHPDTNRKVFFSSCYFSRKKNVTRLFIFIKCACSLLNQMLPG